MKAKSQVSSVRVLTLRSFLKPYLRAGPLHFEDGHVSCAGNQPSLKRATCTVLLYVSHLLRSQITALWDDVWKLEPVKLCFV